MHECITIRCNLEYSTVFQMLVVQSKEPSNLHLSYRLQLIVFKNALRMTTKSMLFGAISESETIKKKKKDSSIIIA